LQKAVPNCPDLCEFTESHSRIKEAAAVILHVPNYGSAGMRTL